MSNSIKRLESEIARARAAFDDAAKRLTDAQRTLQLEGARLRDERRCEQS